MMNRLKRAVKRVLKTEKGEAFPQTITVTDIVSAPLVFRAYSPMEKHRVVTYAAEREALDTFLTYIQPTDVVYDIGASVGVYALPLGFKTPQGQVFAFEPDPETNQRLKENVALNRFRHVTVIDWAASDKAGSTTLYTDGAKGNAPTMLKKDNREALKSEVTIPTDSIDHAITQKRLTVADVLKIDIEGAEGLCIKGAHQLLSGQFGKKPRIILLEIHPDFMASFGMSPEQLQADMLAYGYQILWEEKRYNQIHLLYQAI
jgi:FkbM family methyltransferase